MDSLFCQSSIFLCPRLTVGLGLRLCALVVEVLEVLFNSDLLGLLVFLEDGAEAALGLGGLAVKGLHEGLITLEVLLLEGNVFRSWSHVEFCGGRKYFEEENGEVGGLKGTRNEIVLNSVQKKKVGGTPLSKLAGLHF